MGLSYPLTRNTIFAVTCEARVKGKTLIKNRKSEGGDGGVTDALPPDLNTFIDICVMSCPLKFKVLSHPVGINEFNFNMMCILIKIMSTLRIKNTSESDPRSYEVIIPVNLYIIIYT